MVSSPAERIRTQGGGTDETEAETLNKLGEFYRDFLLRPFECQAVRTEVDLSDVSMVSSQILGRNS